MRPGSTCDWAYANTTRQVIRVVKKELRQLKDVSSEQLRREATNEALATFKASHRPGFPDLIAWDTESTTLILTNMGRWAIHTLACSFLASLVTALLLCRLRELRG